jgi:hypothetical protein
VVHKVDVRMTPWKEEFSLQCNPNETRRALFEVVAGAMELSKSQTGWLVAGWRGVGELPDGPSATNLCGTSRRIRGAFAGEQVPLSHSLAIGSGRARSGRAAAC